MNLNELHRLVRQLAFGDTPQTLGMKAMHLTKVERQALRALRRRTRQAGGIAALLPVSGTTIWTAPPRSQVAE